VPASAVIAGKLWIFGGGNPFLETTNSLQVYNPATNTWTSGPALLQQRSFPAGTNVGNTAVAVGGYTGPTTTNSVEINVTTVTTCGTPTATATSTATAAATSTATATATATAACTPNY